MFKLFMAVIFLSFHPICDKMQTIREKYHEINNSQELEAFIELANTIDCDNITPYLSSAIMRRAEYVGWPLKKWNYFQEGKEMLEQFISWQPENIEARYVRFLVQSEIPAFLGYKDEIKEDADFIKKNITHSEIPEAYKNVILENIESVLKNNN